MPSRTATPSNGGAHFPSKFKNFFRISSSGNNSAINLNTDTGGGGAPLTPKTEAKDAKSRSSRFLGGIGRNRSVTTTSEGNPLEEGLSPTMHANPYFTHQGPPALRHHNEGSVPSTPPDTPPTLKINDMSTVNDQAIVAGKEELARKLRRVASAPNAQGLFAAGAKADSHPLTASLSKEEAVASDDEDAIAMLDAAVPPANGHLLHIPSPLGKLPSPGQIRQNVAFRRTYSSNSIKVRNVEVGPGSFDKIKLIGKGDVGKVYLVREKKSARLYAMKS